MLRIKAAERRARGNGGVTVLTLILSVFLVGTVLLAHETPEMEGARLALYTWAHALTNADIEELKAVLDQDMTFNERTRRDAYLQSFGRRWPRSPTATSC